MAFFGSLVALLVLGCWAPVIVTAGCCALVGAIEQSVRAG